jgi:hypothetical protein
VLEVRVRLDLAWDMLPDDYLLVAIDTPEIVAETIHEFRRRSASGRRRVD